MLRFLESGWKYVTYSFLSSMYAWSYSNRNLFLSLHVVVPTLIPAFAWESDRSLESEASQNYIMRTCLKINFLITFIYGVCARAHMRTRAHAHTCGDRGWGFQVPWLAHGGQETTWGSGFLLPLWAPGVTSQAPNLVAGAFIPWPSSSALPEWTFLRFH